MEDEPHDAVKLLLARMDSHPEEFRLKDPSYHDRWYNHMSTIQSYGSEADKAALNAKIRDVRMAEVHEQIIEELCNGPENRRKEEEENEYERHLKQSLQHMKQQQARQFLTSQQTAQQAQQGLQNAYQSQLGSYQNALGIGTQPLSQPLTIGAGGTGAITAAKIEPTLSPSVINQIRKALKL